VRFDSLSPDQQGLLKDLTAELDFYGVLLPRTTGPLTIKSVCRDTAILLQAMVEPSPLPPYLQRSLGEDSNRTVAELVLDGVLEIECDGRFVSGAEAFSLIYAGSPVRESEGLLPRLSLSALEYAQALAIDDIGRLSARLYFYNRIPLTPQWSRLFRPENAISEFLGISGQNRLRCIHENWSPIERPGHYKPWFHWQSRNNRVSKRHRRHGYKLYVSPQPDATPDAFRAVIEILNNSAAHSFKIGRNSIGLLRPDKLVLYFSDFYSLQQTASDIADSLSGCPVHGVPFTAELSHDGLLSWGIDPPRERGRVWWQETESWRLWITNRLAAALVSARNHSPYPLQPWQFAVERLRLENIDTRTWAPTHDFGLSAH
jgi:hypothetical protein